MVHAERSPGGRYLAYLLWRENTPYPLLHRNPGLAVTNNSSHINKELATTQVLAVDQPVGQLLSKDSRTPIHGPPLTTTLKKGFNLATGVQHDEDLSLAGKPIETRTCFASAPPFPSPSPKPQLSNTPHWCQLSSHWTPTATAWSALDVQVARRRSLLPARQGVCGALRMACGCLNFRPSPARSDVTEERNAHSISR